MKTRSFFQIFRGFLALAIVGTIGLTFQTVYTALAWERSSVAFGVAVIALWFISSIWSGMRDRDFFDWNRVELDGNRVTAYKPFGRKLATVDLTPGRFVYWAKVYIPRERGKSMAVLVLSNEPFSLPADQDRLFRTVFDDKTQVLIADAEDHPSVWFPEAELLEVPGSGFDVWL